MIDALLTAFKKRKYPEYVLRRDPDIWPVRHELLDYEKALELEALLDEYLQDEPPEDGKKTPLTDRRFVTPGAPASASAAARPPLVTPRRNPVRTPSRAGQFAGADLPQSTGKGKAKQEDVEDIDWAVEEEVVELPPESPQSIKAKKIIQCLDAWLMPNWELHLEMKRNNSTRPPSLQRFECGAFLIRLFS